MDKLIYVIKQHKIPNADCIEKLLLNPTINTIDVNQRGDLGKTALHHAVFDNNIEAVTILLEHGADSNIDSIHGNVPFAYILGNVTIAKLLIKYGANVIQPNTFGYIPIRNAIMNHYYDIVKLLIEHCVDVYHVHPTTNQSPIAYVTDLANVYANDKPYYRLLTSYRAYIQLLYFALVFPDLPTYIILWTVDWLDLREMTEYRKVEYIVGFKRSIENIRSKKLIDL